MRFARLIAALIILVVIVVIALVGRFSRQKTAFSFDLSHATYTFMGDTFSLTNGRATIKGHIGLPGAPANTLVPMGYTLVASTTGDITNDGSPDGVAVLNRSFGANLEWLALFGFS
ncbi:MAG: hypothetical protein ACREGH_00430, partial [Minisyncoccia bacterium]